MMTPTDGHDLYREILATVAPGTPLRDGLERILRGRTGALVVIGWDRSVESMCTGGFPIDIEFSATRLRELSKMDGAVIMSSDASRIVRAGVHLMPSPSIPTEESGTRHRTAQRVARETGFPVIAVSQSMRSISLYIQGVRHAVDDPPTIQSRANQALATLEKYKHRLDEVAGMLGALEIEDLVTVRDAVSVSQRLEMVSRISDEIAGYVIELGDEGRLITLQLEELMAGVVDDRLLILRDYIADISSPDAVEGILAALNDLNAIELLDLVQFARIIGLPTHNDLLDTPISPRGYRLLARVPRLPQGVVDRLVETFGSLQRLLGATTEDLQSVDGVGDTRARGIRESLSRLAETSVLERY